MRTAAALLRCGGSPGGAMSSAAQHHLWWCAGSSRCSAHRGQPGQPGASWGCAPCKAAWRQRAGGGTACNPGPPCARPTCSRAQGLHQQRHGEERPPEGPAPGLALSCNMPPVHRHVQPRAAGLSATRHANCDEGASAGPTRANGLAKHGRSRGATGGPTTASCVRGPPPSVALWSRNQAQADRRAPAKPARALPGPLRPPPAGAAPPPDPTHSPGCPT